MPYALSLQQPWAELILQKRKVIETRSWNTKLRGEFFIHASKTIDRNACKHFKINPDTLTTGALVGKARLTATKQYLTQAEFHADQPKHLFNRPFRKPKYGFVLTAITRIKPVTRKGKLGFWWD